MNRRAFTLIEVLTAVAIVVLVAAVTFPVMARARFAGFKAESVSHLRQVGAAIELYRSDNDGQLAFHQLDPFVLSGQIRTPRLLRSHNDHFDQGYGRAVSDCIDQLDTTDLETSYETALVRKAFYDHLMSIDPNAAIVVDRTHGSVLQQADRTCRWVQFYYSGPILRLYEDTSVRVGQFSVLPKGAPADVTMHWSRVRLFTDVDPPQVSTP